MSQGFVKLHRSLLEWEWYDDINVMRLFLHLILKANHKGKKWRGIDIKRGQLLTSLDSLSRETGLTVRQIRTSITKLKSTGEMTSQATSRYTLLTLENYGKYQGKQTEATSQEASKSTNERQASDKQATTNKNDKNEKNINNQIGEISIFLRGYGITFAQTNPIVLNWISQNVSVQELEQAVLKTAIEKRNLNYLNTVIFNIRAENQPKEKSKGEKIWERFYKECLQGGKGVPEVFNGSSKLILSLIEKDLETDMRAIRGNTDKFNRTHVRTKFIKACNKPEANL